MRIIIVILGLFVAIQVSASDLNKFESATAEFSLVKPDEWQFATAEENLENLKRMKMSVPSKAKAIKLDNPAQEKSNQQPVTELHMLGGNK